MTNSSSILVLLVFLEAIIVMLGSLTFYLYKKLEILHKAPGSLIFTELVLLFLIQIEDLVYLITFHTGLDESYNTYGIFAYLYGNMCCVLYEDCIAIEVLLRLKNSPMGKNYRRRVKLYHVICNLLAMVYVGVLFNYREDIYKHGTLVFEYDKAAW
jgi:hypothetical protein